MKKALLALMYILTPAFASAEIRPKFTIAEAMSVAFVGGEVERLPLTSVYGIALVAPLDGFNWLVEGALATPEVQFTPAYRLITGPIFSFNPYWSLVTTVMIQYRPEYEGVPGSDLMGWGMGPGIKVTDELTLFLILSGSKVLEDGGPFGLTFQPKLAFNLPL